MAITIWHRLECDTVANDPRRSFATGLAAMVYDPLWLLARQYQLGERRADNGGSIVGARLEATSYPIHEIVAPEGSRASLGPLPLTAAVESEPIVLDLRLRVRSGLAFVERLVEEGLDAAAGRARTHFRFAAIDDEEGASYIALADAPDGAQILAALTAGTLRSDLHISTAQGAAFDRTIGIWQRWLDHGLPQVDAWVRNRLEHQFDVTVRGAPLALRAPAHRGTELDWDAFDLIESSVHDGEATSHPAELIPLPIDVPGMPTRRFWEIEDPRFDAGQLTAGPGEVLRVLLVEIAVCFANDWLVIPCSVRVGGLCRIDSLVVTDTFGTDFTKRRADELRPDPGWALWRLSGVSRGEYILVPDRVDAVDGEAVEEVSIVRDELANMMWGHERILPSTIGDGRVTVAPAPLTALSTSVAELTYVPLPTLPPDRIPLALDGSMIVTASVVATHPTPVARGEVLHPRFELYDEELGQDGLFVSRRPRLQRARDGRIVVWTARSRRSGAHQPPIRIAFDDLIRSTTATST